MDTIDERLAVIQPLSKFWHGNKVAALDMLRLDLVHPVVSGNKWFKLRLNLSHAAEAGYKTIITPGGGYSNHLVAAAYAAKLFGLKSIGVVRGRYDKLTPTLVSCKEYGMDLLFVTKEDYEGRHEPGWARSLVAHFDELFMIPEGGANEWGRAGAGLLSRFVSNSYTHIALAVGSGTTFTGLRNKTAQHQQLLGFVPMKDGAYMAEHIAAHIVPGKNENWRLFDAWNFGGFGRWNDELIAFMNDFHKACKVPLDVVYTSKMMYGVHALLHDNFFSSSDRILCIHSGGLQGNSSVNDLLSY